MCRHFCFLAAAQNIGLYQYLGWDQPQIYFFLCFNHSFRFDYLIFFKHVRNFHTIWLLLCECQGGRDMHYDFSLNFDSLFWLLLHLTWNAWWILWFLLETAPACSAVGKKFVTSDTSEHSIWIFYGNIQSHPSSQLHVSQHLHAVGF